MDFEILKVGSFVNNAGKSVEFSQDDLNNIAASYDPSISEAPIVIGHPKSNDPAYGWIDALKVNGDKLIASASKIVPEFLTALKEGLFKKRSISLNPDNSLRHVGFLGATLPAVKGLADLSLAESHDSANLIEFEEVETSVPVFVEINPEIRTEDNNSEIQLSAALAKIEELAESFKTLSNNFSEYKDMHVSVNKFEPNSEPTLNVSFNFSTDFKDEIEQAFLDGKLTVPMKEKILSLLTQNFSSEKFSLENFFSEFLSDLPVIVSHEDIATAPLKSENKNKSFDFSEFTLDEEAEEIHKKILLVMDEKTIPYQEAAQIVFNS